MAVSDAEWDASLPRIAMEFAKAAGICSALFWKPLSALNDIPMQMFPPRHLHLLRPPLRRWGRQSRISWSSMRYNALVTLADDFTLMSPFGGTPSRDYTPERLEAMGRFFRNGTFEQEVVETYGSPDMVVLAIIERRHVEVGGLPQQD